MREFFGKFFAKINCQPTHKAAKPKKSNPPNPSWKLPLFEKNQKSQETCPSLGHATLW